MSAGGVLPGLWPIQGEGVLARQGDLVLLIHPAGGTFTDRLLNVLAEAARARQDGLRFTEQVSAEFDADAAAAEPAADRGGPAVVAFGPAGGGTAMAVYGTGWAHITTTSGAQRLTPGEPYGRLRCVLPSGLIMVSAGVQPVAQDSETDPYLRLADGMVRAVALVFAPEEVVPAQAGPAEASPSAAGPEEVAPGGPAAAGRGTAADMSAAALAAEAAPAAALAAEPSAVPPEAEHLREEYQPPAPSPEAPGPAPEPYPVPVPEAEQASLLEPAPPRDLEQGPAHALEPDAASGLEPGPHDPGAEYYATRAEPFPEPYSPGGEPGEPYPPQTQQADVYAAHGQEQAPGPDGAGAAQPDYAAGPGTEPAGHPMGGPGAMASELIEGIYCQNGHFNDPDARECAACGIGLEQAGNARQQGMRPPLGVIILDDGSVCQLDADYVIGREPTLDGSVAEGRARPLRVADSSGVVSRIHARVELDGWHVFLTDLKSANGTQVLLPGERNPISLQPGVRTPLVAGALIRLGGEFGLQYDSRRPA